MPNAWQGSPPPFSCQPLMTIYNVDSVFVKVFSLNAFLKSFLSKCLPSKASLRCQRLMTTNNRQAFLSHHQIECYLDLLLIHNLSNSRNLSINSQMAMLTGLQCGLQLPTTPSPSSKKYHCKPDSFHIFQILK